MRTRIEIDIGETQSKTTVVLDCAKCKLEMCLVGIKTEDSDRELYTFECSKCGEVEARPNRLH
jgi:hypothetical protein